MEEFVAIAFTMFVTKTKNMELSFAIALFTVIVDILATQKHWDVAVDIGKVPI